MNRLFGPIPRAKTLSVMPTYQCTAACTHCGTYSNPKQTTWLDADKMLAAIEQALDSDYKVVVFTGGEPTLAGEDLLRGIRLVDSRGVCSRVVTNAWWATDEAAADSKLAELVSAGLKEINFSTGDQHARFVPVDNIMRGARAAAKIPLKTIVIMMETVEERTITKETILQHPEYKRIQQEFPRAKVRIVESPWMPLSPRMVTKYPPGMAVSKTNLPIHTGCSSCLGTTTVQADGRIAACCGLGMRSIPELQLGHVRDTTIREADERGENDFLKRWIRVEGPEKILAWASRHDPEIVWEDMYAHRCQSCMRLYKDPKVRSVIREHHQEKIPDVIFSEWLLYHYEQAGPAADESVSGEGYSDAAAGPSACLPTADLVTIAPIQAAPEYAAAAPAPM